MSYNRNSVYIIKVVKKDKVGTFLVIFIAASTR